MFTERAHRFFASELWKADRVRMSPWRFRLALLLQWLLAIYRAFKQGDLGLRATSLVYTSLLSFAPLLAVSFSVLKAFGVRDQIAPFLKRIFEPLGQEGAVLAETIVGFVENMNVSVLGGVGVALLFYTVVSLLEKIEEAFNHIWKTRRSRTFLRRFSDYLSIILVGPVLIFSAVALTASLTDASITRNLVAMEPFATALYLLSLVAPLLLTIAAFSFIYVFIPNVRVRPAAALAGGVVAGLLWKLAGWGFGVFVAASTSYNAIYSSFAILILFILWIDVNWLIVLLGGQISFFYQHPEYVRIQSKFLVLSSHSAERAGLLIMRLIGEAFNQGGPLWSLDALAIRLALPRESVGNLVAVLRHHHLLTAVSEPPAYVPGRALDKITVSEILTCIRQDQLAGMEVDEEALRDEAVDALLAKLEQGTEQVLGGMSLQDLLQTQ